ncbi:MAG: FecR domain-containing protein [Steroidobacteraceae bacterium]
MSSGDTQKTDARRLVEASAWRTHLTENDLESTPAFEAWLMSDSRNRAAWESVQQSWNLFVEHATSPEVLDLRRAALGQARSMGRARWTTRHARVGRFARAAVAAAVVLLAFGGGLSIYLMSPDVYRTAAGERRVVTLADGSQVQLDSLTELRVDYSEHARDLKLVKGQARFDVAHDVQRPFSVVARDRKIVATGTAFNVDLLGKDLYVTLLEGKVVIVPELSAVSPVPAVVPSGTQSGTAAPKALQSMTQVPLKVIELQPGQQLAVSRTGAATVAEADVQRATAWQEGQLVFEDEPLSSVVARVSRYSARPVNVADEKTASLRISGVFHAGDVEGFVATVTHYLPVKAQQRGDVIYLSTIPAGARDSGHAPVVVGTAGDST